MGKGTKLEENLGAADVELSIDELQQLVAAAASMQVEGDRYREHLMKTTGL